MLCAMSLCNLFHSPLYHGSLSFNIAVAGACAHHCLQLTCPLMSLILGVLLIPLFSRVYIPRQLINFSFVLPHLQLFTVDVVRLFWSKHSVLSQYYTNPLPDTHSSTSGTLSADSKRTQSRGPCSLSLPRCRVRIIWFRARAGPAGGEPWARPQIQVIATWGHCTRETPPIQETGLCPWHTGSVFHVHLAEKGVENSNEECLWSSMMVWWSLLHWHVMDWTKLK